MESIRCIAAPVFGHAGQVVASMCAVGPKSRITHQKLRALRAPLLELARALSEQLGWRPANERGHGGMGPPGGVIATERPNAGGPGGRRNPPKGGKT